MSSTTPDTRLASLDILRGFDLFLLVFFQPVFVQVGRLLDIPVLNAFLFQFDHEIWEGFRFWDVVMPLFMFMSGVSMPFSFSKYKGMPNKTCVYRRILKRVVLLFFLGMIVQGNILDLSIHTLHLYNNTLQAIAVGYFIAAMIFLNCSVKWQMLWIAVLLMAYSLPMIFCGDFSQDGNFANKVDALLLGRFRGDATYTWIWSSLTFGVTVMLGVFAGRIMKRGTENRRRTALLLLIIGSLLIAGGMLWSLQMPIIKRIWTSSMTLLSGGYCFVLMSLFYYVIDYRGRTKGFVWLKIYGMNSITAYMLGEAVNFRSIAESLFHGTEQFLGIYYPTLITFVNFLIIFFILHFMYKYKVFLRI